MKTKHQTIWIGLTLFSMFFGAGNLIFAPYLGHLAGIQTPFALLGFLCTAVGMPIFAILILSKYKDGKAMLSEISPIFALFFMSLIYLLIGPCVAIPRTASTSFEMFGWLLPDTKTAQILYSIVFFALAFIVARKPSHLKDIIGKYMCPILLVLTVSLCIGSFLLPQSIEKASEAYQNQAFGNGFLEGYQTMDILAAYCFGTVILMNIQSEGIDDPQKQRSVLKKAAWIAGALLALLYSLLALSGMLHADLLNEVSNGAQILSILSKEVFGPFGQIINALIFLIACFNVCVGLLSCVSEYFYQLFPRFRYIQWLLMFTIFGLIVSTFGLDWILQISAPILNILCPLAIVFLLIGWFKKRKVRP